LLERERNWRRASGKRLSRIGTQSAWLRNGQQATRAETASIPGSDRARLAVSAKVSSSFDSVTRPKVG
jgi:hypothetical protein